jgi:hypothetical protein
MKQYEEVRKISETIWLLISIESTEGWEDPEDEFYFCVRKINEQKITLPEWRDLNHGKSPLEEEKENLLLQSGLGLIVAAGGVHTIGEAKKLIVQIARETSTESTPKTNLLLHHRKWEKLREEDPSAFSAGFYLGSRKQDLSSSQTSKPLIAGWRQGWEFAVGKMGLPEWIKTKKKSA